MQLMLRFLLAVLRFLLALLTIPLGVLLAFGGVIALVQGEWPVGVGLTAAGLFVVFGMKYVLTIDKRRKRFHEAFATAGKEAGGAVDVSGYFPSVVFTRPSVKAQVHVGIAGWGTGAFPCLLCMFELARPWPQFRVRPFAISRFLAGVFFRRQKRVSIPRELKDRIHVLARDPAAVDARVPETVWRALYHALPGSFAGFMDGLPGWGARCTGREMLVVIHSRYRDDMIHAAMGVAAAVMAACEQDQVEDRAAAAP